MELINLVLISSLFATTVILPLSFLSPQQKILEMNPELHYLSHIQNTSISKHCNRFQKASRFHAPKTTKTQFYYCPNYASRNRSCNFGYGQRKGFTNTLFTPSPDKYNTTQFPNNRVSHRMGLSRDEAIFGTITVQIKNKASIPAPGTYKLKSTLKQSPFTLKERLQTDNGLSRTPGPGEYQPIGINETGLYPTSNYKNARKIILDGTRTFTEKTIDEPGPGAYELSSAFKPRDLRAELRQTKPRTFGVSKRKGPQNMNAHLVPGPGMYEYFSPFGVRSRERVKTEY